MKRPKSRSHGPAPGERRSRIAHNGFEAGDEGHIIPENCLACTLAANGVAGGLLLFPHANVSERGGFEGWGC